MDFLSPLLGIDPDYLVILLEYIFERLTEFLVRSTLGATLSFPRRITFDDILGKILDGGKAPAVERRSAPPPGEEPGLARRIREGAVDIATTIRESIDPDVLRSLGVRIEEASINPADAPGYLSTRFRVAASG